MPVFNNILAGASGATGADAGYQIDRSLRFNDDDSAYLSHDFSTGNRKTWTWSAWVKRSTLGFKVLFGHYNTSSSPNYGGYIGFVSDKLVAVSHNTFDVRTTGLFRDVSAWYHIIVAVDTTLSTQADRVKLYVNGARVTDLSSASYPSQNADTEINKNVEHDVGKMTATGYHFDGYMAEIHFVDGQALAASDFGEYDDNNVWQPKEFEGSYNVNVGYGGTVPTSTTDVAPAGDHTNGIATAAVLFGGTELTNGQNHIRQDGGGIEWSAAIPLSSGDVAGAKCLYFNNTSSHDIEFKINGSWVTAQTNAQNVIGSTQGQGAIITYTASGSVNWTGVRAANGSNGSVTTVAGIYVNNNLVGAGTTAANGFYLNFSDNSSNAALGTDSSGNSNTWTVNNLSVADGVAVTVSAAAGALPIRNTTGDQGGTAASGFRTDANASNLFLALPLNTNTSDVSNSINSSSATKSTTNQSTATSSSQSRFYGASSYWNANSDGILVAESGSELVVGTGDFTIEFWFYDDSNHSGTGGRCYLFDNRIGGSVVGDPPTIVGHVDGSSTIKYESSGGGAISHSLSTDNKWIHYAAVRNSGTTTLYINGSSVGSHSDTTNYTNNGFGIGRATDANYGWAGYIMDFRVYKTAKYTSNFSIPAEANPTVGAGNDSLIDTPTNYEAASGNNGGNYATFNPLVVVGTDSFGGTNGNLDSSGSNRFSSSTIAVSSGKFYFETTVGAAGVTVGIWQPPFVASAAPYEQTNYRYFGSDGKIYTQAGSTVASYNTYTTGDVIGIALDMDNGKVFFSKNGTWQGSSDPAGGTNAAASGLTGMWVFGVNHSGDATHSANFGQRPFAFTPPTGFKSLCTTNLPDPTIADGSTAFDTVLYSGDGQTTQTVALPFAPGLVWQKKRSHVSAHYLLDAVRGFANDKALASHDAEAEGVNSAFFTFSQSGSNITVGDYGTNTGNEWNTSGRTYAVWTWDAGSSNTSISAGGLNSSFYNQDQVWSNFLSRNTVSGGSNLGSTTDAFNGTIWSMSNATNCGYSNDYTGSSITFAPTSGTLVGQVVKLYQRIRPSTVTVNGTAATITTSGNTRICTVDLGSPQNITSVVTTATTIGETNAFSYIEVDGKLLIDSGVSLSGLTQYPTIASTVRANQSAGFSIVSYTGNGTAGATIGHNLNAVPKWIITKCSSNNENWRVYTETTGNTQSLFISTNEAPNSSANYWNSTSPTSSVFSVGNDSGANNNGYTYIAYCFAPVEGYSAFGSYTGNGDADGPFIYTGFRPKFILRKQTNSAQHWHIADAERDPENPSDSWLFPNLSDAEGSGDIDRYTDILSNGFKIRSAYSYHNQSGSTYIYAAFAEHPLSLNGGLAR